MREPKFRVWQRATHQYRHFVLKKGVSVNIRVDLEIEQSTGLNYKNGREIYEGDLIRILVSEDFRKEYLEEYHHEIPTGVCQVSFECGAYIVNQNDTYYLPIGQYRAEEIEVIGNIHENPELLEAKA